jgi:hypothetical protein
LARDGIDWPEQQAQELQKAGEQRQLVEEKKPTFAEALLECAERKLSTPDHISPFPPE